MKRMTVILMILAMLLCCVPVQAEEAAVPVSGITLSAADLVLAPGIAWRLTAQVEPENATNTGIVWKTTNDKVAAVDEKGIIRSGSAGQAVITAEAADGSKVKAEVKVSVQKYDVVFDSVQPKNVEYKIAPGKNRHITAHVDTGCVRISEVDYRETFEEGKQHVDVVNVSPVKAGPDVVSVTGTGNNLNCRVYVCPDVFPECGGALLTDENGKDTGILFMNLPWDISYTEAKYSLDAQGKAIKNPVMHDITVRAQMDGKLVFGNIEATHAALDFAYPTATDKPLEENALYRGLYYFDPETPFEQVRLAVRSVYGLDNGEHDGTRCSWEKDGVELELEKKEKFTVLTVTRGI